MPTTRPSRTDETFLDNARIKARHGRALADPRLLGRRRGLGIEVAALGGKPGIHSARWADDPVERMLAELDGVVDRRARYVCELVALAPDRIRGSGDGNARGIVADAPRGDEGFGYDPIFVPLGETATVAELGNEWKSTHSHRAQAATALARALAAL